MFILVVYPGVVVRHLPILTLHMRNQWLEKKDKESYRLGGCSMRMRIPKKVSKPRLVGK